MIRRNRVRVGLSGIAFQPFLKSDIKRKCRTYFLLKKRPVRLGAHKIRLNPRIFPYFCRWRFSLLCRNRCENLPGIEKMRNSIGNLYLSAGGRKAVFPAKFDQLSVYFTGAVTGGLFHRPAPRQPGGASSTQGVLRRRRPVRTAWWAA